MKVQIDDKAIKDLSKIESLENYRILFQLKDDSITIYRVKHRSKVYE